MKRTRSAYSRGLSDLPSILVALSWAGIWLLWPRAPRVASPRPTLPPPRAARVAAGPTSETLDRRPDFFGRPSEIGFRSPSVESPAFETGVPAAETESPGTLGCPPAVTGAAPLSASAFGCGPDGGTAEYRPRWSGAESAPQAAPAVWRLQMETRGGLAGRTFILPPVMDELAKGSAQPWMVVADVDVGADGTPEHIFVVQGTDDRRLTMDVVRALAMGKASNVTEACSGSVALSYGAP